MRILKESIGKLGVLELLKKTFEPEYKISSTPAGSTMPDCIWFKYKKWQLDFSVDLNKDDWEIVHSDGYGQSFGFVTELKGTYVKIDKMIDFLRGALPANSVRWRDLDAKHVSEAIIQKALKLSEADVPKFQEKWTVEYLDDYGHRQTMSIKAGSAADAKKQFAIVQADAKITSVKPYGEGLKEAKMPVLADFTTKAFGDNWWEDGSFRQKKPGARVVTKKELAAVVKDWRAAVAAAEKK